MQQRKKMSRRTEKYDDVSSLGTYIFFAILPRVRQACRIVNDEQRRANCTAMYMHTYIVLMRCISLH